MTQLSPHSTKSRTSLTKPAHHKSVQEIAEQQPSRKMVPTAKPLHPLQQSKPAQVYAAHRAFHGQAGPSSEATFDNASPSFNGDAPQTQTISPGERLVGYGCIVFSQILFIILLPYLFIENSQDHFFGPMAYGIAHFFIDRLFGITSFFIPLSALLIGGYLLLEKKEIGDLVRKLFITAVWFFVFNLFLLGWMDWETNRFAGLFPRFFHALLEYFIISLIGAGAAPTASASAGGLAVNQGSFLASFLLHAIETGLFLMISWKFSEIFSLQPRIFAKNAFSFIRLKSTQLRELLLFFYPKKQILKLSHVNLWDKLQALKENIISAFRFSVPVTEQAKAYQTPASDAPTTSPSSYHHEMPVVETTQDPLVDLVDERVADTFADVPEPDHTKILSGLEENDGGADLGLQENLQEDRLKWLREALEQDLFVSALKKNSTEDTDLTDYGIEKLPVTELPVTELPVTELPVTELPVTELPVTELPVIELPVTHDIDLRQTVLFTGKLEPVPSSPSRGDKKRTSLHHERSTNKGMGHRGAPHADNRVEKSTQNIHHIGDAFARESSEDKVSDHGDRYCGVRIVNHDQELFEARSTATASIRALAPAQTAKRDKKVTTKNEQMEVSALLEKTFADFGIRVDVVHAASGPVITSYELKVEAGVRLARILNLADNLALALAAPSIRIIAPVPGKAVVGIEIPNRERQMVRLSEIVESQLFIKSPAALPVALGASTLGTPVIADLTKMPHLLVAGATGSGKSVLMNALISSLILSMTSNELRFLMIDPKMVELNVYNSIPHLLTPVISDSKEAALSLRWLLHEMEARYRLLEQNGVRSLHSYHQLLAGAEVPGKIFVRGTLPYIVVIIDEFADLMMTARKDVEDSISRLAAMSRAVGIHLLLATQRPSVDVITGVIKANFPSRVAFQVSSKIDSRTIIDGSGAEKLLGQGDMLFQSTASLAPKRIQGAFLSDEEVSRLIKTLEGFDNPFLQDRVHDILAYPLASSATQEYSRENDAASGDALLEQALLIAQTDQKISASYLQRKLKIGYNRAARIVEIMEKKGWVSSADGVKPREVFVS